MTIRKLLIIGMATCAAVLAGGCDRKSAENSERPAAPPPGAEAQPISPPTAVPQSTSTVGAQQILLNRENLPPAVARVEGLGQVEPFGRWSTGKQVRIEFNAPLPPKFTLEIVLGGFGPNIGADAQLNVGPNTWPLKIEGGLDKMQTSKFTIENSAGANAIVIDVPRPTSPASLGRSNDGRTLGIAVWSVTVSPA